MILSSVKIKDLISLTHQLFNVIVNFFELVQKNDDVNVMIIILLCTIQG